MTQNKKFKKQVRARMEKTGETYTAARRALMKEQGREEEARPWSGGITYKAIGYWKSIQEPHLPDPMMMVDPDWDPAERKVVLEYLRRSPVCRNYMGESWCRLGCGRADEDPKGRTVFDGPGTSEGTWEARHEARKQAVTRATDANMTAAKDVDMGTAEQTDGVYVWPEGLAHYVAEHNVRLPPEFVEHVGADPTRFHGLEIDPKANFVYDELWWRSVATGQRARAAKKQLSIEEIRKVLHRTWHEIWDRESGIYHVYEDGPEDGRTHTSLCGDATTTTWETKTPGRQLCEICKLLKVKGILAKQKVVGDPIGILHDPELWAAAGGTEEDRLAVRDDLWGEPPDVFSDTPSKLELELPFNKGWYFHDTEYPEEGSEGPYKTLEDAKQAADLTYDPEDPNVSFFEQKKMAVVVQKYLVEHFREEITKAIEAAKEHTYNAKLRSALKTLLTDRMEKAITVLERQGIRVPPSDGFRIDLAQTTPEDMEQKRVRAKVIFTDPDRYADLIRELQETGLFEPQHMIGISFEE